MAITDLVSVGGVAFGVLLSGGRFHDDWPRNI
jgi:hypothetical protein